MYYHKQGGDYSDIAILKLVNNGDLALKWDLTFKSEELFAQLLPACTILYQEVEYLQSTGYQRLHIDLNDNGWLNEGVVYIKFEMVSTSNGQALFNDLYYNNQDNNEAGIGITSGYYVWASYENSDYSLASVSANTPTEITICNSTNASFYKINNGPSNSFPSSYDSSRAKNVFPAISLFADNTSVIFCVISI